MTRDEFNRQCTQELENSKFPDRIAIIGSGPSSPYVAPVKELLEKLQAGCGVPQDPNEEFWNYCERAYCADNAVYYEVIKQCYSNSPHWDARAYNHLIAIRFKSYVTLNYDNQLPHVFLRSDGHSNCDLFSVYPERPDLTVAQPAELLHKRRLVAVHGYCDSKNPNWNREVILRREDYNQHYLKAGTKRFLFNWWKNLLVVHPCVFIGTSLREPGLARVVEDLIKDGNDRFLQHDHIHLKDFQYSDVPPHYTSPGKSLSVFRQIAFDPIDNRFTGLLKVLSHFSGIDPEDPSPGMLAPTEITPTEKFPF